MTGFSPARAILRRREGERHPPGEIEALIEGFVGGGVADYQMTAWMMATYFEPLDRSETARLIQAMIASGRPLPPWKEGPPVVDKHSTGGVGDKVSLIVAPLAAACGLRVPMISGRALGHTGGTLDKLDSIVGYKTQIPPEQFCGIVERVGCSIAGTSESLVPADRRMYALRDVSGIVESPPLIVASILSKKASARLQGLVLDVKVGRGGFIATRREARELARRLVEGGEDLGMRVEAVLTAMEEPIGRMAGNALEVLESIRFLRGEVSPPDLAEVSFTVAESMLRVGHGVDSAQARARLQRALRSGEGLERLARMIEAHGGDPRVTEDPNTLPLSRNVHEVSARQGGWIRRIDARAVGEAIVDLGGGRRRVEDCVDPRVGLEIEVRAGARVKSGQPLASVHMADGTVWDAGLEARIRACFDVAAEPPRPRSSVLGFVGSSRSA